MIKNVNLLLSTAVLFLLIMHNSVSADGNISEGKAKYTLCQNCHVLSKKGANSEYPYLVGKSETYLQEQLKAYRDGFRSNNIMRAMTFALSNEDIENLAAYIASR